MIYNKMVSVMSIGNTTNLAASLTLLILIIGFTMLLYYPESSVHPAQMSNSSQPISHATQQIQKQPFCDEECRWLQLQSQRRQTLHRACAAFKETSPPDLLSWLRAHISVLPFLWVSDKHKVVYCNVPKVASSNWKKVFYILNNGEAPYNQSYVSYVTSFRHIHFKMKSVDWRLMRMSPDDVIHRLTTYTKLIIVREPFARTLSAYREKFEKEYNQKKFMWKYWIYRMYLYVSKQIKENIKGWVELPSHRNESTWPEFVKFVSDPNSKLIYRGEQHWMPISELCFPCQINYDIIGKLETMDTDAKFILKRLGVSELKSVVSLTDNHDTNSSDAQIQDTYLNELSMDVVKDFEQRYVKDFNLFGYNMFSTQNTN